MKTQYIKAARPGLLRCKGDFTHQGQGISFLRSTLTESAGYVVAFACRKWLGQLMNLLASLFKFDPLFLRYGTVTLTFGSEKAIEVFAYKPHGFHSRGQKPLTRGWFLHHFGHLGR